MDDRASARALILIDHGSRLAEANSVLHSLVALVGAAAGTAYVAVEPAHMEMADPSLAQALANCVSAGASHVVVVPVFITPGRHSAGDIPEMAAAEARKHPGLRCSVAEPLGADSRLAGLLIERAESAFEQLD